MNRFNWSILRSIKTNLKCRSVSPFYSSRERDIRRRRRRRRRCQEVFKVFKVRQVGGGWCRLAVHGPGLTGTFSPVSSRPLTDSVNNELWGGNVQTRTSLSLSLSQSGPETCSSSVEFLPVNSALLPADCNQISDWTLKFSNFQFKT